MSAAHKRNRLNPWILNRQNNMQIKSILAARVEAAFAQLNLDGPAVIQAASRAEFGDYQANGVMGAAKRGKRNPREVAAEVVEVLDLAGIASNVEIAGPGFLNITLDPAFLAQVDAGVVAEAAVPERVVVDYSAPNLAKEMHVGHLRSSIIGDCLARVLENQGHTVFRQNHVGDWGTQFGMLLTYMADIGEDSDELSDLEEFYRAAKQRFDADEDFQTRARLAVVNLQSGDPDALAAWQRFITISMTHCQEIYERLGTTLQPEHTAGESMYNDALAGIIQSLDEQDLLQVSDGARCVFLDEFKNKQGDVLPVIVQKSDGGYLYATTDLAAVQYRTGTLAAKRILIFTDARQAQHFKQVFKVAELAGFNKTAASLEHMPFGSMLGADGKPFKTRAGGVVRLADVLDEAEQRAADLARSRQTDAAGSAASADDIAELGRVIGIGALKYADLSKNRTSDYVFDWDQMLALEGNTAPYLQYIYARVQRVFERGEVDPTTLPHQTVSVNPEERRLAVSIAAFNDTLRQVADEGMPHFLCSYLYELATRFNQFYEACPILKESGDVRERRLVLCQQTAATIKTGLSLLGIGVVNRM